MYVAESVLAPRVAELMGLFNPGVRYKLKDEGKAHLANKLEKMFNAEPMVVMERNQQNVIVKRVIKHKFEAYKKLSPPIQEHYDTLFGKPSSAKKSGSSEAPKELLPFGFGAYQAHR